MGFRRISVLSRPHVAFWHQHYRGNLPLVFFVSFASSYPVVDCQLPLHLQIGKNYMDHVKEMGGSKALSEPIYFLKPFTSVIRSGEAIVIPPGIGEVHHELELALVIGSKLKNALPSETMAAISGFAISLDMTARDMQVIAFECQFACA
jgi:2-keto-4-pentenoate hydratase/2-oxohepta-3-ene-1,7-dioic acid hydratase in catechol pathway